jgi:hypothetical protein
MLIRCKTESDSRLAQRFDTDNVRRRCSAASRARPLARICGHLLRLVTQHPTITGSGFNLVENSEGPGGRKRNRFSHALAQVVTSAARRGVCERSRGDYPLHDRFRSIKIDRADSVSRVKSEIDLTWGALALEYRQVPP